MVNMIGLTTYEFYGMVFGWVLAVLFGLLFLAFVKLTPAKTFLKAWMNKKPVVRVVYPDGITEFRNTDDADPGSLDIKGIGSVNRTRGSNMHEKQSKVTMYDVFVEYGSTIPPDYAVIVQELRESGFKINNYGDYAHLIKLASNETYASEFLKKINDQDEKEKVKIMITKLAKLEIHIEPMKTYRVQDLEHMFPNNVSPSYVDAKVTVATNRRIQKMKMNNQFLIYGAIAVLILVIAAIIVFKVIKTPEPQVIVQTVRTGVEVANQSLTM